VHSLKGLERKNLRMKPEVVHLKVQFNFAPSGHIGRGIGFTSPHKNTRERGITPSLHSIVDPPIP
jgi:hypothetical protein